VEGLELVRHNLFNSGQQISKGEGETIGSYCTESLHKNEDNAYQIQDIFCKKIVNLTIDV